MAAVLEVVGVLADEAGVAAALTAVVAAGTVPRVAPSRPSQPGSMCRSSAHPLHARPAMGKTLLPTKTATSRAHRFGREPH